MIWLAFLVVLLRLDGAGFGRMSAALWIPVVWIAIMGSRLPSQWLGGQVGTVAEALQEGNPLDRSFYLILMCAAFVVLASRSFEWRAVASRNGALVAFIFFGLLSIVWSDFTFIALKRWFRDLGNYIVLLIIISDPQPVQAFRLVIRRVAYLLVPLSVVLVKYFPQLGRQYTVWEGTAMYVGVTTSKNMLGVLCLTTGLFFTWDIVTTWRDRHEPGVRTSLVVDGILLGMTLWLLRLSDSATSRTCFVLGVLLLLAMHTQKFLRYRRILAICMVGVIAVYALITFGGDSGLSQAVTAAVGRNATLTGRTDIWAALLSANTNPLLGTGYQSFWLGSRLQWIWQQPGVGMIGESHNGYLDVYLNLGIIGLLLLGLFLVSSYRKLSLDIDENPNNPLPIFGLVIWMILLLYNVTEAAFMGGVLWLVMLPSVLAMPCVAEASSGSLLEAESSCYDLGAAEGGETWNSSGRELIGADFDIASLETCAERGFIEQSYPK